MNPFKAFLRNNLKVLGIGWGLLSRSQASNVARFYAVGPEEVAEFLGGRLLNFGLWETRRESHQEAARSLLHRVATLARLDAAEAVVDAGCGFGQPAMEFHSSYGARRVLGLNVTRCQLDHAARVARVQRLEQRVHFLAGDATRMPLAKEAFDRVIALESAFHFSPREAFFREAWRVLRPGGLLVLADVVPLHLRSGRFLKALAGAAWLNAPGNRYDTAGYLERLGRVGFRSIEVQSIGDFVFEPYVRWTLSLENRRRLKRLLGWPRAQAYIWQTKLLGALDRRGLVDYLLVRAIKEVGG